jgi:hypothetical protein
MGTIGKMDELRMFAATGCAVFVFAVTAGLNN